MPPGGDGWYYFFAHFRGSNTEYALFNIQINGNSLCTMVEDTSGTSDDGGQGGCGTVVYATEGILFYLLEVLELVLPVVFALWGK